MSKAFSIIAALGIVFLTCRVWANRLDILDKAALTVCCLAIAIHWLGDAFEGRAER